MKTTVDWIHDEVEKIWKDETVDFDTFRKIIDQAKEMEKYQIVTAYKCGKVESNFPLEQFTTGYMYYEEKYGNKGQKD